MEILNAYLIKKTPTNQQILGGRRSFTSLFSHFTFLFFLPSFLLLFLLFYLWKRKEKHYIWRKCRSNIFFSFLVKKLEKFKRFYSEKVHMKSICHFLISTVVLLIKSIQPTNLCKLKMLVQYTKPAFLGNYKRNAFFFFYFIVLYKAYASGLRAWFSFCLTYIKEERLPPSPAFFCWRTSRRTNEIKLVL